MGQFVLNHRSVILCPHGGIVTHISTTGTSYRVDGQLPMLLSDVYTVAGCPFSGSYASPCQSVQWLTASSMLYIRSIPALIQSSTGICMSAAGVPNGPAVVAAVHSMQREPDSPTFINE